MTEKYYFEDFILGQKLKSVSYQVSRDEIVDYASQWDPQPFHIDEEVAKASIFGGLTACSSHIFAMYCAISQQWETKVVPQALAGLGFDALQMRKPVYADDVLYCVSETTELRRSKTKPDRGIVRTHCELINQDEEVVFSLTASFMMKTKS